MAMKRIGMADAGFTLLLDLTTVCRGIYCGVLTHRKYRARRRSDSGRQVEAYYSFTIVKLGQ